MEKQPACAAAMSSSGFVPAPFSKRVPKEYCVSCSTPLAVEIDPLPSFSPPFHCADALRLMIMGALYRNRAVKFLAPVKNLTKREREIMDVLYRDGELTAAEVGERLPGEPSNSTVRTILRILEEKGHVKHEQQGMHYVYKPTVHREKARR